MPLTIAAKVDEVDRTYHETRIKPLLDDPQVDFVGEIGDSEKGAFLGDAERRQAPPRATPVTSQDRGPPASGCGAPRIDGSAAMENGNLFEGVSLI